MTLRLLVAEGNTAEARSRIATSAGTTPSDGYATVLRGLAPAARVDIATPADADPQLRQPIESYDGVVVTGSALNIHRREEASLRQIAFAQAVFAAGVPMFGSCWGLQLAAVAAGGDVAVNPRGRELAFARGITLTAAGRHHPLHRGRPAVFDAPAIHGDEVVRLPPGATVTAGNAMSSVQAAEIRHGTGVFWGVQYHPEYDFHDIAAMIRRYGQTLVDDRHFQNGSELQAYAEDLSALHDDAACAAAAARLRLGPDLLDAARRTCEIRNWLIHQVKPASRLATKATRETSGAPGRSWP